VGGRCHVPIVRNICAVRYGFYGSMLRAPIQGAENMDVISRVPSAPFAVTVCPVGAMGCGYGGGWC
jgi:hypothetical protein